MANSIGFRFLSFIVLTALLIVGFFGGEQQLQKMYPDHSELIQFISDIIRLAFWVIIALVIIVIIIAITAAVAKKL